MATSSRSSTSVLARGLPTRRSSGRWTRSRATGGCGRRGETTIPARARSGSRSTCPASGASSSRTATRSTRSTPRRSAGSGTPARAGSATSPSCEEPPGSRRRRRGGSPTGACARSSGGAVSRWSSARGSRSACSGMCTPPTSSRAIAMSTPDGSALARSATWCSARRAPGSPSCGRTTSRRAMESPRKWVRTRAPEHGRGPRTEMDFAQAFVRFVDRHRVAMLAAAALLAAWGAVGTVALYSDLRTDVGQLLPESTRSARDLDAVTKRVGGFAEHTVVLHGADRLTLEVFADDLSDELAKEKGLVRWVEHRNDELRDFFLPRLLLFPDKAELVQLRDALRGRIAWEKAHAAGRAPAGPAPDVLGIVQALAGARKELLGRFPDGYYVGEVPGRSAGAKMTILALIVRMEGTPDDYAKVVRLDRAVKAAVRRLDPKKYAPGLEVAYAGHVTSNVMEHDALAEDLVWATLLVVLAVAGAVALYNRTWKAVPAVGIPLLVGAFVTFGLGNVFVGHLNTNTAFLGSIVVGNGINVGLIFFARYLEERRGGRAPAPAMEVAVRETWLGTLTAALAAGAAYASLMSTDFRGFSQFGLIGGIGMTLSWITSYLVTPPLVLAWERRAPGLHEGGLLRDRAGAARHDDRGRRPHRALDLLRRPRRARRRAVVRVRLLEAARSDRAARGRRGVVGRARGRAVRRPPHPHGPPRARRGRGAPHREPGRGAPAREAGRAPRLRPLDRVDRARGAGGEAPGGRGAPRARDAGEPRLPAARQADGIAEGASAGRAPAVRREGPSGAAPPPDHRGRRPRRDARPRPPRGPDEHVGRARHASLRGGAAVDPAPARHADRELGPAHGGRAEAHRARRPARHAALARGRGRARPRRVRARQALRKVAQGRRLGPRGARRRRRLVPRARRRPTASAAR